MSPLRRTLIAVLAGVAVLAGLVVVLGGHRAVSTPVTRAAQPSSVRVGAPAARAAIGAAQRAFVHGYLAYLDGVGSDRALPLASITAREQAGRGGRIPPALRDGPLRVTRVSGAATAYSAQATVTAANRSESYVLAVAMLLTPRGWRVAQLTPPDLAMDDRTRPAVGPSVPAAGQLASRTFAVAYAAYRMTRSGALPAGVTATARQQLTGGQDPLAGVARAGERPRLLGVRFGPREGAEFAVTAAVRAGRARERFTVLMVNRSGRWECDAFL